LGYVPAGNGQPSVCIKKIFLASFTFIYKAAGCYWKYVFYNVVLFISYLLELWNLHDRASLRHTGAWLKRHGHSMWP